MINTTKEDREKFKRVKLNMEAIKKATLTEIDAGKYTPMMVNTMVMLIDVIDGLIKESNDDRAH